VVQPAEYVDFLQQVKMAYAELVLGQREIEKKIEQLKQRIEKEIAEAINIDEIDKKLDRERLDLETREEEAVIANLNQTPKGLKGAPKSRAQSVASTPTGKSVSAGGGGVGVGISAFSSFPSSSPSSSSTDREHRTFHSLLFSHMQFQFHHRLSILGPILYDFVMIEMLVQKHRQRSLQTIQVKMEEIERVELEKSKSTRRGSSQNGGNGDRKMKQTLDAQMRRM